MLDAAESWNGGPIEFRVERRREPDFRVKLKYPPATCPYSAAKLLVWNVTSWIASTPAWVSCFHVPLVASCPSTRIAALLARGQAVDPECAAGDCCRASLLSVGVHKILCTPNQRRRPREKDFVGLLEPVRCPRCKSLSFLRWGIRSDAPECQTRA